jgi:NAD(P)H-dependent FMN reductase
MYVPIILGTAREGRQSEKAAKFMIGQIKKFGLETEIVDVRDFRIEATDNTQESVLAKKLEKKISKADALIIVSPEYNHGYPGELKMMLDLLYQQYFRKPLGICGVSSGGLGGARMVEQLRLVAIELHMVPIREAIYFSGVQNLFDDKNKIKDQTYIDRVKVFLEELIWYAETLKSGREKSL